MIKQDILRSLTTRIEMHCESLIEEEHSENEEGCSKIYHEVPRRVFARLLGSKLLVSDYLFPGEGQKDSVITFRDILTLRLESESDIIMTMEKPFSKCPPQASFLRNLFKNKNTKDGSLNFRYGRVTEQGIHGGADVCCESSQYSSV
jgi:hypothetical protein